MRVILKKYSQEKGTEESRTGQEKRLSQDVVCSREELEPGVAGHCGVLFTSRR